MNLRPARLVSALTLIPALALCACTTIVAPRPDPIVTLGIEELKERHYDSARALFHAATVEEPSAAAAFYEGAALNRLGRFAEALERLDQATASGLRHPEVDFEAGWSLLGLRRWDEAIARLERYERRRPGRAKTSEFLGRAYIGAWQPEQAAARLRQATERDPALAPGTLFYLAVLERTRNDQKASDGYVRTLLSCAPPTRLALVVPATAVPRETPAIVAAATVAPAAAPVPLRYVRARFANVRQTPSLSAKVLTVVKAGLRLTVLAEQTGWYRVRLEDGREGWVAASVTRP